MRPVRQKRGNGRRIIDDGTRAGTRDAYEALGSFDSLVVIDSDDAGHVETRAMRDGVLSFLNGMRG